MTNKTDLRGPVSTSTDVQDLRIAVMQLARRLRTERASDAMTPAKWPLWPR